MPLYLSPYIGLGTKVNPFRPVGLDTLGSSAIDIRIDATRADGNGIGFALLWLPTGSTNPQGSIKIADDYGDQLTSQQRTRLNNRTGLDFGSDTSIQDAIETIMFREDFLTWKRLRPARGIYEVWLGSSIGKRKWINLPAIAGGSISDNFNRANETPISSPWTQLAGSGSTINLASNAMTHASVGDTFYYYSNGAGWNADQTSEFNYATLFTDSDWGPAVRIGSNGFSGYWYNRFNAGAFQGPVKMVSGSFTQIANSYSAASTGNTYRISVVGSTIRCYNAGVEDAASPATDSSLTTAGNGAGVFIYNTGGSVDNFLATGEITSGGSTVNWIRYVG
jgi:hypothetical protein